MHTRRKNVYKDVLLNIQVDYKRYYLKNIVVFHDRTVTPDIKKFNFK